MTKDLIKTTQALDKKEAQRQLHGCQSAILTALFFGALIIFYIGY